MSSLKHPSLHWFALFLLVCGVLSPRMVSAQAAVTVCTQEELEARILEARESGDGWVTFDCDGSIFLTNTISLLLGEVDSDATNGLENIILDASGHSITINGLASSSSTNSAVRLFLIDSGISLTVTNIKFINGRATNGGAFLLRTNAALTAINCVFSNNLALGSNGISGKSASTNMASGNGSGGGGGLTGTVSSGGAIHSLGEVWLSHCTFLTNGVVAGNGGDGGGGGNARVRGGNGGAGARGGVATGGAIHNQGRLTTANCSFYFNYALGGLGGFGGTSGTGMLSGTEGAGGAGGGAAGGAVFNAAKSFATNFNTTFAANVTDGGDSAAGGRSVGKAKGGAAGAQSSGGGLANFGNARLINCTFFANGANGGNGGSGSEGRAQGGTGGSGGSAWGGNLFSGGRHAQITLTHCTIADGGAVGGTNGPPGGGSLPGKNGKLGLGRGANIANSNGFFTIQNSIVANPISGTNGYGKKYQGTRNIISDLSLKTFKTVFTNMDPKLGTLRLNGGSVQTIELLADSPAIDFAITNFSITADARNILRPSGTNADIGAFEYGIVLGPPRILAHPRDVLAREGFDVTFDVTAGGDAPLRYQWRKDGEAIDGETSSSLALFGVGDEDAGAYTVVVSNNSGSTTSGAANLTIAKPPVITVDLSSFTNDSGADFTLSITAEGDAPLRYEWYGDSVLISGASLDTLFVSNPQQTATYQVVVRNEYGDTPSSLAVVTIAMTPPSITTQPVSRIVAVSNSVTFSVGTAGSRPQSYQWYFNLTNLLAGATNQSYRIPMARATNEGSYHVVVINQVGTTNSTNVTLVVQLTKPTIVTQPVSFSSAIGGTATFGVEAAEPGPLGYRWYFNTNTLIAFATNSVLTLTNVQATNWGFYQVVVTNLVGSVTSTPAVLSIPPAIQTQPLSASVYQGDASVFSVVATSGSTIQYQWFFNGVVMPGANSASVTINNTQATNAGSYFVRLTNALGAAFSASATLTVLDPVLAITSQPVSLTLYSSENAVFGVVNTGRAPISYQWFFNGTNLLAGATNSQLTVTNVQATNVGSYFVRLTNTLGSVSSAAATLTVLDPTPVITSQPLGLSLYSGEDAVFSVTNTGLSPFSYQWFLNGTNLLSGATSSLLTITNVQTTNAGNYHVVITNAGGAVTSAPASLLVTNSAPVITAQPPDLVVPANEVITLTVGVVGSTPMTFQWYHTPIDSSGTPISGPVALTNGTSATLILPIPDPGSEAQWEGIYSVTITNPFGTTISAEGTVNVEGFGVPP